MFGCPRSASLAPWDSPLGSSVARHAFLDWLEGRAWTASCYPLSPAISTKIQDGTQTPKPKVVTKIFKFLKKPNKMGAHYKKRNMHGNVSRKERFGKYKISELQ